MNSCTIGVLLGTASDCHKTQFCKTVRLRILSALETDSCSLLLRRSNLANRGLDTSDATVCYHHEKLFLDKYSFLQKACCDPCSTHSDKPRKKSLRTIDLQNADLINQKTGSNVHPGMKLCPDCRKMLAAFSDPEQTEDTTSTDADVDIEFEPGTSRQDSATVRSIIAETEDALNKTLTDIGYSPLKIQRISQRDKHSYGKRKASEVKEAAISSLATCLRVSGDVLEDKMSKECDRCADLELLISDLKEKMKVTESRQKKLQILTMAPNSWTVEKTASEFGVPLYMVKQARSLKKMHGILPDLSAAKKGKVVAQDTVDKVVSFYESDEYSRMCPGKKDYVSVRIDDQRVQRQKRLLLINLNELFQQFKEKHPENVIGFSKFCELRPRWCVTVSSQGSHSVCVCAIHQNVKLMVSSLKILGVADYKDLLQLMVCDIQSRDCMIHECDHCPGIEAVQYHITSLCKTAEIDEEDLITFKQWEQSDQGVSIVTRSESLTTFVDELSKQLENLTVHHYIAKSQAAFLSSSKLGLTKDTAIVLLDFAENYSFIVQDAIQGHHWNNSQATLHPFAVYHRTATDLLECLSICVVSDCMQHDSITVHAFITVVLNHLKTILPYLKQVNYFSDGAASQYKNFKNLSNLVFHEQDHGLRAEWHFFATSHGKSPCDGIGGTVKRLVARASLHAATTNHILTAHQLFQWSESNITGIKFFFVPDAEVQQHRQSQEIRFTAAKKVPGVRTHHCFIPLRDNSLRMFRLSSDTSGTLVSSGNSIEEIDTEDTAHVYIPGKYVAAVYDQKWYVGNVMERDDEKHDLLVNFMREMASRGSFQWPRKKDSCWVPTAHILCTLPAPTTASGRHYHFEKKVMDDTDALFQKFSETHF